MRYTRVVDGDGIEDRHKAMARRARRAANVMRTLCISRNAHAYVFAGFRYDNLRDAVAHSTRYLRKDAVGATIMLRPGDAQD
jgi:hypothetical protein